MYFQCCSDVVTDFGVLDVVLEYFTEEVTGVFVSPFFSDRYL